MVNIEPELVDKNSSMKLVMNPDSFEGWKYLIKCIKKCDNNRTIKLSSQFRWWFNNIVELNYHCSTNSGPPSVKRLFGAQFISACSFQALPNRVVQDARPCVPGRNIGRVGCFSGRRLYNWLCLGTQRWGSSWTTLLATCTSNMH